MPGAQVTGGTYAPPDSGGRGIGGRYARRDSWALGGRGWRVCPAGVTLSESEENRGELCISGIWAPKGGLGGFNSSSG
jgi:hypothetical protein